MSVTVVYVTQISTYLSCKLINGVCNDRLKPLVAPINSLNKSYSDLFLQCLIMWTLSQKKQSLFIETLSMYK